MAKKVKMANYKFNVPSSVNTVLSAVQWFLDEDMKLSRASTPNYNRVMRCYIKGVVLAECKSYDRILCADDSMFHIFVLNSPVSARWVLFCNENLTREELADDDIMNGFREKYMNLFDIETSDTGVIHVNFGNESDKAVIVLETLNDKVIEIKTMKESDLRAIFENRLNQEKDNQCL